MVVSRRYHHKGSMYKDVVDKYLGVPFKHRGRDITGLDCYGLIVCVYADCAIKLFDIDEEYPANWGAKGKNYFLENYYKQWEKVESPKFLDVVLFKNAHGVCNHAGVYLHNNLFIHTSRKAGTVVTAIPDFKNKVEGFYRFKL